MLPQAHAAEMEAWRRRRLAKLTAGDGWLSVVGLQWLAEGENTVGFGAGPLVTILVDSGAARLTTADGTVPIEADPERERPFWENAGRTLSLISRQGRFAVRARDRAAAARAGAPRIPTFPLDSAWRLEAHFEPYAPTRTLRVPNVLGGIDEETCPGALVFDHAGMQQRVDAIAERGEIDLWIVFGDATNGPETYGGGRFVYAPLPDGEKASAPGRTVLDFNKAYNPPCVFTPYSLCPLPPPQNKLPFAVTAGEKLWHPERSGA